MMNANLIEHAPAWKLRIIDYVAKMLGVLVHVEGIPFGSPKNVPLYKGGSKTMLGNWS